MHIFTEAGLIFLKHWNLPDASRENGYADFEINSCSRCGICTNVCQLSSDAGITHSQAVYYLRDLRYSKPSFATVTNCFLCGRCSEVCPVDIGIDQLRLASRRKLVNHLALPIAWKAAPPPPAREVEVLYFAGCMSHLTPGIIESTRSVLTAAGISHAMLDAKEGLCCGRPAMQAGFADMAKGIIQRTTALIEASGAAMLLVTCPICYKVFNEEYNLPVPVEHHSVYFDRLIHEKPYLFTRSSLRLSYHDPCDLGRGSGIYQQPRSVIRQVGELVPVAHEKADSLCCGGSLANLSITPDQRALVTDTAYQVLASGSPDYIVTSCPLCKKTFSAGKRQIPVIDLAEALAMTLHGEESHTGKSVMSVKEAVAV